MVQRNSYFARQKYALIAMLGDFNENVRSVGVAKMPARRKQVTEESANNDECPHALSRSLIRLFDLPLLNLEANAYYELANSIFTRKSLQQLQTLQIQKYTNVWRNLWYYTTYMS